MDIRCLRVRSRHRGGSLCCLTASCAYTIRRCCWGSGHGESGPIPRSRRPRLNCVHCSRVEHLSDEPGLQLRFFQTRWRLQSGFLLLFIVKHERKEENREWNPEPVSVALFGNSTFADVIKVKTGSPDGPSAPSGCSRVQETSTLMVRETHNQVSRDPLNQLTPSSGFYYFVNVWIVLYVGGKNKTDVNSLKNNLETTFKTPENFMPFNSAITLLGNLSSRNNHSQK